MGHKQVENSNKQDKESKLKNRAKSRILHDQANNEILTEAFKKFAKYGTDEFYRINGKNDSFMPLVIEYKRCTIVGSWHVRQVFDEQRRSKIEETLRKVVLNYIKRTPKNKRFVMVEGITGGGVLLDGKINIDFKDFDSAVKHEENHAVLFLAKEHGIKATSPEPTILESMKYLSDRGFSKDEAFLFFVARQVPHYNKADLNAGMAHEILYLLKESKPAGSAVPTESRVLDIIDRENKLFEKLYGKPMIIKEETICSQI